MDTERRRLLGSIQDFHGMTWAAIGFAAVICAQTSANFISESAFAKSFQAVTLNKDSYSWLKNVHFSVNQSESFQSNFAAQAEKVEILPLQTVTISEKKVTPKRRIFHAKLSARTIENRILEVATRESLLREALLQTRMLMRREQFSSSERNFRQLREQFIASVRMNFSPIQMAAYHLEHFVDTSSIEPARVQTLSDAITLNQAASNRATENEYSQRVYSLDEPMEIKVVRPARTSKKRIEYSEASSKAETASVPQKSESSMSAIFAVSSFLSSQTTTGAVKPTNAVTVGQVVSPPLAMNIQPPKASYADSIKQSLVKETASNWADETIKEPTRRRFVEAFKEQEEIASAESVQLERHDGSGSNGWISTKAEGHISTIAWMSSQDGYQMDIPLLSQITIDLLKRHPGLKMNIQSGTGMIFGKISAGELIDASVRPDQVVYIDQNLKVLRPEELTSDRSFIIFNVLPGASQIRVQSLTGSRGAVSVLVEKDSATYIDVRASYWKKESLSGRVLDSSTSRPIANAEVAVIDQKNSISITDRQGNYKMASIDRLADVPYYFEVKSGRNYPHRYRQSSSDQARQLYVFNEEKVQSWISQLEGGVSGESGIIAGALKKPALNLSSGEWVPEVQPRDENSNLSPEAYLLDREGMLEAGATLSPNQYQIVGVQVPAGPVSVSIRPSSGASGFAWSELTVVSPGVVSVVESF